MEKINIASLLKECPTGMELDCVMYDNLYFDYIREHAIYPIVCYTVDSKGEKHGVSFNWYGKHTPIDTAKCVIFPKGKTTWEGFIPPCQFKDGDIIYTKHKLGTEFVSIFRVEYERNICIYWGMNLSTNKLIGCLHDGKAFKVFIEKDKVKEQRFATEEEKQKLFKEFKDNGYTWNAETKTLEKLIQPKFKVEDVVISNRGDIHLLRTEDSSYCAYRHMRKNKLDSTITTNITVVRLATEEEKERLFDAIKENGYRWNTETKTLDKLPKFKDGNIIKHKDSGLYCTLEEYSEGISAYRTNIELSLTHKDLEQWELVPNKFDITTLIPFESRVLVRDNDYDVWRGAFWGYLREKQDIKYDTTRGVYRQCIPYEGNEHLLGKTDDCADYFKTWE